MVILGPFDILFDRTTEVLICHMLNYHLISHDSPQKFKHYLVNSLGNRKTMMLNSVL